MPMRRRTDNRTHAEVPRSSEVVVLFIVSLLSVVTVEENDGDDEPSSAARVSSTGRGNKRVKNGASGVESSVDKTEPIVVSTVITKVASNGWNSAPARTFCITKNKIPDQSR